MMKKRKNLILIGVGMLMVVLLLTACGTNEETTTDQPAEVTSTSDLPVTAEGVVLPEKDRTLAFKSGGMVCELYVEEGDEVQVGDVLAELRSTTSLEAQQVSLNYDLIQAQQALDDLIQNEDVDREQAWQAVLDAKDAYDAAQIAYNDLDQDQYDDDIANANEEIIDAQKDVDDAQDDLDEYIDLDEDNETRESYQDILDQAMDSLDEKKRAKTAIENEHDLIISQFHAADAALQVEQAEYDKRADGPNSDMLTQLNAQIDSINAQLTAVEDQLYEMNLTAPISGEVVQVNYDVQEFVSPGDPAIIVADTNHWRVESTDLTELEVAKLSVGQAVTLEADAFPGKTFTGTIEQIGSYPQTLQGDVIYTVQITIDDGELPALRWGMTLTLIFK